MKNIKKFIIELFRQIPFLTGFMLLLVSCHLAGIQKLTAFWKQPPEAFKNILIIYWIVAYIYIDWVLPTIEKEKRNSCTWTLIITSIVSLTILGKLFP